MFPANYPENYCKKFFIILPHIVCVFVSFLLLFSVWGIMRENLTINALSISRNSNKVLLASQHHLLTAYSHVGTQNVKPLNMNAYWVEWTGCVVLQFGKDCLVWVTYICLLHQLPIQLNILEFDSFVHSICYQRQCLFRLRCIHTVNALE